MIIGAILISLGILVLVVIFVTRPLYKSDLDEKDDTVNETTLHEIKYQQSLSRIRELEQEHQEGKINDPDYQQRREMLNRKAAEALQKIDAEGQSRG